MINIFDYIKNYCDSRNIENYSFKSSVITLDEFSKNFSFAPSIAFFYKLQAVGEINNTADFGKPFLQVSTPTDFFDFSKICSFEDMGNLQKAVSDFIFVADNTMQINISVGADSLFNTIKTAQLFYISVAELPEYAKRTTTQTKGKNIIIDIN